MPASPDASSDSSLASTAGGAELAKSYDPRAAAALSESELNALRETAADWVRRHRVSPC